jgi:hypothetical protein
MECNRKMLKPEYDNTENVRIIIYGFWIVVNKDTAVITFRILSIIQHQYHDINKDRAVITFRNVE